MNASSAAEKRAGAHKIITYLRYVSQIYYYHTCPESQSPPDNPFYNFGGQGFGQSQTGQYTQGVLTGGQTSTPEGLPQQQNSSAVLPGYLGLPFQIIVSPFARFDPTTRSTDILMFNSRNLGALVVKEDPHVQNWEDARYGIQEMFIEESYGFGIIEEVVVDQAIF